MAILLCSVFLCAGRSHIFILCVFLCLPILLSQFAFLIKLLELCSTGCQALLPGSPLLLLPSLPGSLDSLWDLRVHKLLSHRHLFFFILDGLLSENTSQCRLLPEKKHSSINVTQPAPLSWDLHPMVTISPSDSLLYPQAQIPQLLDRVIDIWFSNSISSLTTPLFWTSFNFFSLVEVLCRQISLQVDIN